MPREYDYDLFDPLDTAAGQAALPSRGFFDSVIAGFEVADLNTSTVGASNETRKAWTSTLQAFERKHGPLGFDTSGVTVEDIRQFVQEREGIPYQEPWATSIVAPKERDRAAMVRKKFKELNDAIVRSNDPELKSFDQILAELKLEAQSREKEAFIVSQTGSGLGSFIGGVGGSFTSNNPMNIATLPLGGFGKTVLRRILSEAAVGAGVEYTNQFIGGQENREMLDLDPLDPWEQIIYAGVGAGAIRGGFELGAHLFRRGFGLRGEPPDVDPRVFRNELENGPMGPNDRATLSFIEDVEEFDRANPHTGPDANTKFEEDLKAADDFMEGKPREERTPGKDYASAEEEFMNEKPEMAKAYQSAKAKLDDVEVRIQAVQESIDNLPASKVFENLDSAHAVLTRELEKYLDDPDVPEALKANLRRKIAKMVDDIGPERVKKEHDRLTKSSKDELAALQKERKAAKKEHDRVKKAVDSELDRIKTRKAKEAKEKAEAEAAQRRAEEGEPHGPKESKPEDIDETVDAASERASRDAAGEEPPGAKAEEPKAEGAKTEETKRPKKRVKVDADGMVNLGDGKRLPANMKMEIEVDGEIQTKTVKEIIEEFFEDEELIDAMKACAI